MAKSLLIIGLLVCHNSFSQFIDVSTQWQLNIGDSLDWRYAAYHDDHWKSVDTIDRFEARGFRDFQNFGWARKKVVIPASMKSVVESAGFIYLALGKIYDADQVFFNGKLIGASGGIPPAVKLVDRNVRIYKVPAEVIRWDNENLIAVRVFSNFHNGGLQGDKCTIVLPSENVFHLTRNAVPSFPLEQGQLCYEAVTSESLVDKQEVNTRGLLLKIKLPKRASIFCNGHLIGKTNFPGDQTFFVPSSFLARNSKECLTVYLDSNNALENILLSRAEFVDVTERSFQLMQVSNLKIKKGALNESSPITASVEVLNTTNNAFNGCLTLSIVTDISNVQQSSSRSIHLDKLQNMEVDFTLTPNFSGVYQLNYVLENNSGEKLTGTLLSGSR